MGGTFGKKTVRMLSVLLAVLMAVGLMQMVPRAMAEELHFDFSELSESARAGSWGAERTVEDGTLCIRYTQQYAEQRYDLPKDIDPTSVTEVRVEIASGDASGFCIKLLKGADQAEVAYGSGSISVSGADFDGIGLMALSENGEEYTLSGITFCVEEKPSDNNEISLKELYASDFRMGVACEAISHWHNRLSEIGNPKKEALILSQFNSITFGNELKPAYNMDYRSKDATETDLPFGHNRAAVEMLDWAKSNGMSVRGHVLVWHSQCEDAVFCKDYKPIYRGQTLDPECMVDAETMKLRMESYIHHVMEYVYANGYGDVIYAWDVVNEAIEPGANADNLRNSYWYRIIGPEFVYDAFKYAREAVEKYSAEYASLYGIDPTDAEALKRIQPKLFYNDYNEFQANKREAIIRTVTPIIADGYLDGIGMQGHLKDTTDIDAFIAALYRYSEVADEVQITELDVAQSSSGPNAEYYQGQFYYELFSKLLEAKQNGAKLTAVTIWGLTDDNSWRKENAPLIFNGDLMGKVAYTGIVNAKTGGGMPEPEYVAPDFTDGIFTFNEKNADAEALGFVKRGGGTVKVQGEETYSGRGALLDSGRTESWHGASFDVSRFAGQTIFVRGWVKTEDAQVKLTADIEGRWPNIATVNTAGGAWTEISGSYKIPADMTGLSLYFETNGVADLYIDEVSVQLIGMDEGFEGTSHIAVPRGVGHMPVLVASGAKHHSGSKCLMVTRQAEEATVAFDISKYVGRTVEVSAFVKTEDPTITLGLEGTEQFVTEAMTEDWTEITGVFHVPSEWKSAQVYLESAGTANLYVDDISVRIGADSFDLEDGRMPFTARWQGAGTLSVVEEDSGHAVKLSNQDQKYYGICYDVTPYLGMEVMISFDVKTEDRTVKLTGDIEDVWPNYMTVRSEPGQYKHVQTVLRLPKERSALRVYIETEGTADLYVDNFQIERTKVG